MQKEIFVDGSDQLNGGIATINWLLDHGMRVTIVGVRIAAQRASMEKLIDGHLKRTARDGDAYENIRSRLAWNAKDVPLTDLRALFLSLWKKEVIGITGAHGKTTTAVWAAHLIDDAVVAGHMPEHPLLLAVDSRARVAIIEVHGTVPVTGKVKVVSTDQRSNLDAAIEVARLAGVPQSLIERRIATLPQVPMRQEVVHRSAQLTVVNDAMATKSAHGISALRRWGGPTCVLICGGTDKKSDYREWARELSKQVRRTNTIFLTGSATKKMRVALGEYGRGIRAYDSLAPAFKAARARARLYVSSVVLFSPAANSFEGQQFNALVKQYLGKNKRVS